MSQHCTFVGNLAANPDLRFSPQGVASVRLSLICQDRYRDDKGQWQDGATHTVWVTAFRDFAERISASLSKGDRVIVVGQFESRKVEQDGETKWFTNFVADAVGPDLRWAEADVRRVRGSRAAAGSVVVTPSTGSAAPADDPWAGGTVSDSEQRATAGV